MDTNSIPTTGESESPQPSPEAPRLTLFTRLKRKVRNVVPRFMKWAVKNSLQIVEIFILLTAAYFTIDQLSLVESGLLAQTRSVLYNSEVDTTSDEKEDPRLSALWMRVTEETNMEEYKKAYLSIITDDEKILNVQSADKLAVEIYSFRQFNKLRPGSKVRWTPKVGPEGSGKEVMV